MKINSRRSIIVFALTVTALVMGPAVALNYVLYPPELLKWNVPGTMVIVTLVTIPTCIFIGMKMRQIQELSDELQRLVNHDRLTDVATRDHFFQRMADRDEAGVCLMIDIDHFKSVNDTHGHLVGDRVILSVAQSMQRCVRDEDVVSRFGGEEFLIYLNGLSLSAGRRVAERMRHVIAEQPVVFGDSTVNVTVSIGAALLPLEEDVERAIKSADTALYQAKSEGRNRTVMADEGQPSALH